MTSISSWYIHRLKSMSFPEIAYRSSRIFKSKFLVQTQPVTEKITGTSIPSILPEIDYSGLQTPEYLDVFGYKVYPESVEDWSLDISTGKSFPLAPSDSIDVRTTVSGSAKHVWEINRMLFLPWLAVKYKSGNSDSLNSIKELIGSWSNQNPYGRGVNWYSNIEVNIRLINWFITWEILDVEQIIRTDSGFERFVSDIWLPSVYEHCRFSYEHPSLFSSANNHLISEYAGLFIASSKWKFTESKKWNRYAKCGLEKEILKQHSGNGINREEAAEYIQFITDFFLISMIVGDNTDNPFSSSFKSMFKSIIFYIRSFLDINGNTPNYGDADNGRICLLNESEKDNNFISLLISGAIYFNDAGLLPDYFKPDQKSRFLFGKSATDILESSLQVIPEQTSRFYKDEGHFIFRNRLSEHQEIYAHFNAAPLGYLSIAAHGHADALSFVLHLNGQPFLTDPGAYCYHKGSEWRKYFVSTAAHNTVTVNDTDQAGYIGPTLWVDHYSTQVSDAVMNETFEYVCAEHNGYRMLKVKHCRKVEFFRDANLFVITDEINNRSGNAVKIDLHFHIHPDITLLMKDDGWQLTNGNSKLLIKPDPALDWRIVCGQQNPLKGWFSPSFYRKSVSPVLTGTTNSSKSVKIRTELHITV